MKHTGVCPKCGSQKIGRLEHVIQRTEAELDSRSLIGHCPAPLGIQRTQSGGFIKLIKEGPVGQLEAYICGACGFYETYVKDPSTIQYDTLIGFSWLVPSA